MPPSTTQPIHANTGDGTILPPATPAPSTAYQTPTPQSDQLQATQHVTPITPSPIVPAAPATQPAFHFNAPDMPTVGYIDPSKYTNQTDLARDEAAQSSNLLNQQNSLEKGVFGQYQQAIDSQGSALDRYNQLAQQMNLPVYQQQVNTIKGLLSRLTDNVNARAQGTFMNQAQRDQLEASEGKSLNNQLAPLAQAQTAAESNIAKMMQFTEQDNQAHLDPIKLYLAGLGGAFGRQITGLDTNNKSASAALEQRLTSEDNARKAAFDAQNAAFDHDWKNRDLALRQASQANTNKYQDLMAGIERMKLNQNPSAAAASGASLPSQGQVNARQWLQQQNVNPNDVRNYRSAPVPIDYGNPLANWIHKNHVFGLN